MCPCNTYFNKLHYCKLNKTLMLIFKNLKKDVFFVTSLIKIKFLRDIIICMYVLVHTHHASVQEKWVEFFGVPDSDIKLASFCWNTGPKTNPNIQKKSSKHIQNHRAMHRTQYPESRYIYIFFFAPEAYIGGPVLRFWLQHPRLTLNVQPSKCLLWPTQVA